MWGEGVSCVQMKLVMETQVAPVFAHQAELSVRFNIAQIQGREASSLYCLLIFSFIFDWHMAGRNDLNKVS